MHCSDNIDNGKIELKQSKDVHHKNALMKYASYKILSNSTTMRQPCVKSLHVMMIPISRSKQNYYSKWLCTSTSIAYKTAVWVTASLVLRNMLSIINNNTWRHEMSSWALSERDRQMERERESVLKWCVWRKGDKVSVLQTVMNATLKHY